MRVIRLFVSVGFQLLYNPDSIDNNGTIYHAANFGVVAEIDNVFFFIDQAYIFGVNLIPVFEAQNVADIGLYHPNGIVVLFTVNGKSSAFIGIMAVGRI